MKLEDAANTLRKVKICAVGAIHESKIGVRGGQTQNIQGGNNNNWPNHNAYEFRVRNLRGIYLIEPTKKMATRWISCSKECSDLIAPKLISCGSKVKSTINKEAPYPLTELEKPAQPVTKTQLLNLIWSTM